jgi:hypothetical protein
MGANFAGHLGKLTPLRTLPNSGQIGLRRFSYSSSAPALTDIAKALRIFRMISVSRKSGTRQRMISAGAQPDRKRVAMRCMAGAEWWKKRL